MLISAFSVYAEKLIAPFVAVSAEPGAAETATNCELKDLL